MERDRCEVTEEPPTQCLLIKVTPMQADAFLHQDASLPPPVGATCSSPPRPPHTPYLVPEFGSGLPRATLTGSCYCTSALERGLSHSASFSLCSKSVPSGKWMCSLLLLWLPEPSLLGTSQSGWLTRPPFSDFHLVSSFTKICLFFYTPSMWLAIFQRCFKLCCIVLLNWIGT